MHFCDNLVKNLHLVEMKTMILWSKITCPSFQLAEYPGIFFCALLLPTVFHLFKWISCLPTLK